MNEQKQTTCKRCGRKLRNPQAIELGMGSVCWKKYQQENNHKKLWKENDENNDERHYKDID